MNLPARISGDHSSTIDNRTGVSQPRPCRGFQTGTLRSTELRFDARRPWDSAHFTSRTRTRRPPIVVRFRVHNPNPRRQEMKRLLVLAEEVVVGSVPHELLITHIGVGRATVRGGRPPLGV